jgi:CheY-like chemotaxis protein
MKRILIVEDVEINLDLLIQLLEDEYQITSAADGESGVKFARRDKPDLIIMDMSLPILDGWSATRRIRSNPETSHIPIIALSAHALTAERERAIDVGCDAYLTKPVDEEQLFMTIRELLTVNG